MPKPSAWLFLFAHLCPQGCEARFRASTRVAQQRLAVAEDPRDDREFDPGQSTVFATTDVRFGSKADIAAAVVTPAALAFTTSYRPEVLPRTTRSNSFVASPSSCF